MTDFSTTTLVQVFREAGPYIINLKNKRVVIGIASEIVENKDALSSLTQDILLLNGLGVEVVVVFGICSALEEAETISKEDLEKIKEATSLAWVHIEAYLSIGFVNLSVSHSKVHVIGGNYVSACSKGIRSGKDSEYLGEVRKIDADLLKYHLEDENIVLIRPLGYSLSGVTYYVPMSEMASAIAQSIEAEKLLFVTEAAGIYDQRGKIANSLTLKEAKKLIKEAPQKKAIKNIFPSVISALASNKVKRVQLITGLIPGNILSELYTREGVGTSLSYSSFTDVRPAKMSDIPSLVQIVRPLEKKGYLLHRSRAYLELHLDEFYIIQYDEVVCGCAQLRLHEGDSAELACLAVLESASDSGYGEQLLAKVQEEAILHDKTKLFALTTHAGDWMQERGFVPSKPEELPAERLKQYRESERHSKVFVKFLN